MDFCRKMATPKRAERANLLYLTIEGRFTHPYLSPWIGKIKCRFSAHIYGSGEG